MYSESVSNLVQRAIMTNTMTGEKYITEADLSIRTGISRTKLRETLKALDSHGMIERKQKCGVAIRSYSREEIKELFELRIMLECRALAKTVANASKKDLFELQQLDNEVEMAVELGDRIGSAVKDSLFHKKLIEISGAKATLRMIGSLHLLESTMKLPMPRQHSGKRAPYTHVDIIEAIRNRDKKKYKNLLVNHIKWVAKEALSRIDKNSKQVTKV